MEEDLNRRVQNQPPPTLNYHKPESGDGCRKAAELLAGGFCGMLLTILPAMLLGGIAGNFSNGKEALIFIGGLFACAALGLVGTVLWFRKGLFLGGLLLGFCLTSLFAGLCFTAISRI